MTALLLLPLMVFAAMAVDVGAWYVRADQAQRAADAAALAGVVWMPDINQAAAVAKDVAARNGYPDQPGCDATPADCTSVTRPQVLVSAVEGQKIRVDILTSAPFYFGSVLGQDSISLHRRAVSEYLLPVPLGNPTSALGMGTEATAGNVVSNYWLRASPDCEPRSTGDFIGAGGGCPNTNPNHRDEGHTFVVDVPMAGNYEIQARTSCFEAADMQQANASMRFRFYDTDNTPLDDNDNVLKPPISEVIVPRPPAHICPANGSGWTRQYDPAPWVPLGTVFEAGRYIIQAKNPEQHPNIRSAYSLRVIPSGQAGSWSCSRIGPTGSAACPIITGKDYLTAMTMHHMFTYAGGVGRSQLYLAEISSAHAGKDLTIELFDPADGIDNVKVLDPSGAYVDFSWFGVDCLLYNYRCGVRPDYGTPTEHISQRCDGVSCITQEGGYSFQDRTAKLVVKLPTDYTCQQIPGEPENCWWKVEYEDRDANIFETTTWGVTVSGGPVRIVD